MAHVTHEPTLEERRGVRRRPPRGRRVLTVATAVLFCVAGINGITGAAATLSAQDRNPTTSMSTGTVILGSNSTGGPVVALTAGDAGSTASGCIAVTYTGTIASTMRLYGTVSGGLSSFLTLTITRGTDSSPTYASCTNFVADTPNYIGAGVGVIYNGSLASYPSTYATGLVDPLAATPESWTNNERHVYKIAVTQSSSLSAQGQSATATYTWEARNA